MSSLHAHLEQHDVAMGALAFRRDCPVCLLERVQGHVPSATLVPSRACAALTAAVLATSAVAPGIVVAADGQGLAAPPPESPSPPQVSDLAVGGGAAAPADPDASGPGEPSADGARPSHSGPRLEAQARATESGPRAERAATGQAPSGASPGSGDAPATQPSPSATPGDERVDASEPDEMHPLDTPEPATTPSPALDETTPTPVPPDASDTAAAEGTAAERARPPVTPALSADLHPRARTTARRAPRSGHDTAGDGERDGGSHRVRATSAPDRDDVEHGQPATYTVRPGDSLWRIADRHLGPHATAAATAREVNRLWQINQQRIRTGDPDLIFPGQRLRM